MDKLIKKLDLTVRFLQNTEKNFIATYITSQKKTLEKIRDNRPYILCTYYVPSELTNMFDVEFIYIERIVGLTIGSNILDNINNNVIPKDSCSYQKAFITLIENKLIPLPKMIIGLDYPCNDAVTLCNYLHTRYNIPSYYLNIHNLTEDFKRIFYQLKKFFRLKHSIEETVYLSNQAVKLKQQIDNYRMKYPGIINSDDCLKVFTVENDFGGQAAISVLNQINNLIKKRIEKYLHNNTLKIFWMGLIPLYNNSILSKVEMMLSCKFVYEEMWMFGNYTITNSKFFEDLTRKVKNSLFYDINYRIENIISAIKITKADIVINFIQRHCSFLPQTIPYIKPRLISENIPMYNIAADVIMEDFKIDNLVRVIESHKDRMNIK